MSELHTQKKKYSVNVQLNERKYTEREGKPDRQEDRQFMQAMQM